MQYESISLKSKRIKNTQILDFPGGTVDKNLPANAEDVGSIPGPGRAHMLWATGHSWNTWATSSEICVP